MGVDVGVVDALTGGVAAEPKTDQLHHPPRRLQLSRKRGLRPPSRLSQLLPSLTNLWCLVTRETDSRRGAWPFRA
jgi:hypothetical protein